MEFEGALAFISRCLNSMHHSQLMNQYLFGHFETHETKRLHRSQGRPAALATQVTDHAYPGSCGELSGAFYGLIHQTVGLEVLPWRSHGLPQFVTSWGALNPPNLRKMISFMHGLFLGRLQPVFTAAQFQRNHDSAFAVHFARTWLYQSQPCLQLAFGMIYSIA